MEQKKLTLGQISSVRQVVRERIETIIYHCTRNICDNKIILKKGDKFQEGLIEAYSLIKNAIDNKLAPIDDKTAKRIAYRERGRAQLSRNIKAHAYELRTIFNCCNEQDFYILETLYILNAPRDREENINTATVLYPQIKVKAHETLLICLNDEPKHKDEFKNKSELILKKWFKSELEIKRQPDPIVHFKTKEIL